MALPRFADALSRNPALFGQDDDATDFRIFRDFAQVEIICLLSMRYAGDWRVEGVTQGQNGNEATALIPMPALLHAKKGVVISHDELTKDLADNVIGTYSRMPDLVLRQITLPPNTTFSVFIPPLSADPHTGSKITLKNDFCTVGITVYPYFIQRGANAIVVRALQIPEGQESQYAQADFSVQTLVECHPKSLSMFDEFDQNKAWAEQLVKDLQETLNADATWRVMSQQVEITHSRR